MKDIVPRQAPPLPDLAYRRYEPSLESEEVHLRDYLSILSKRRRLVASVFLISLLAGICVFFPTTPRYKASATLKIEPQNPLGTVGEAVNIQYSGNTGYDYYKTQFELLKSNRLAKRVITDLDLSSNPAFLRNSQPTFLSQLQSSWFVTSSQSFLSSIVALVTSRAPPSAQVTSPSSKEDDEERKTEGLLGRYLGLLNIDPIRDTRLARVEFTTLDPHLSQELANAHAATFIRTTIETRFELTKEARDFLEKKLADIKDKLERSEKALDDFRQGHSVVSLEGNDNIVAERMVDLNRRLVEARTKRIEVEALYRTLSDKNPQNLSQIIANTRIQELKTQLGSLEVESARLAMVFKPDHPSLQELNKKMAETRRLLNQEIATIQRGIESDYAVASSREKSLQAESEREQQAALNLKRIGIDYTIRDQEAKAYQALYERLLQRLNETNISNTTAVSNIDIAEEALLGHRVPSTATRNLLAVAALGLMLGAGLAFVAEYFNSIVETPEGVWRAVGVPTLGVVPHLRSLRQPPSVSRWLPGYSGVRRLDPSVGETGPSLAGKSVVFPQPFSLFHESYRTIRTALLFSQKTPPPQVLVVTSAHPDEGKTVTTLNLAISLTQNGYTVVVVDADLRKGNCHALLRMANLSGLSNVLSDHQSLQACVRRTSVRGLSFLSRGTASADPTDLLSSPQMKEGLADLRAHFDFVLIDSPPVVVVSDATVLATLCDGVLVVINAQKTTLQMAQLLRDRLEAVCARIVGVVLNGVDIRNPNYAYYRSYYKSYYAGTGERETPASPSENQ